MPCMVPTLPPYQVFSQQEEANFRLEIIKECKILLKSLNDGLYNINWEGTFPIVKTSQNFTEKKIEIKVESKLEFIEILQLKKPIISKKIRICGQKPSCLENWTTDQLIEFNTKLLFA